MRECADLARELQLPIHIHASETADEVFTLLRETGLRPIEWLSSVGALDERAQLVHCVCLDRGEIELLAASGATVVHCPVSNLFLSSGLAPVGLLNAEGINLALGTDGSASNGTQDLLESAKVAILISASVEPDRALDPSSVMRFLTTGAGRLVNLTLESMLVPGAKADVAIFDLALLPTAPCLSALSTILFSLSSHCAHTVIVNGRVVIDAGRLLTVDEDALLRECRRASLALLERAGLIGQVARPGLLGPSVPAA